MYIKLREKNSNLTIEAEISLASIKDMPLKKHGWNFNWNQLYKQNNVQCYKINLISNPDKIEALALFYSTDYGLFYMNQVEASPENKSNKGKYEAVASLIAYGCKLSFNIKDPYRGYLGFTSKTNLISLYQSKYKAKLITQQMMCIEPKDGLELINYYLGV